MHNSVLYWLRAEYRKTDLAQDASPVNLMRGAMQQLARHWQKKFDEMALRLARRFAGDVLKTAMRHCPLRSVMPGLRFLSV